MNISVNLMFLKHITSILLREISLPGAGRLQILKTFSDFSAVAYFFGKYIYDKYKVPVGLINSSLGGSPAESWLSEDAIKEFPKYYEEAQKFKDSTLIKQNYASDDKRMQRMVQFIRWQKDKGEKNNGNIWSDPP